MSFSPFRLAWLVLLAGVAVIGPAHAQTTLRYQFKKGDKLHYQVEQSSSIVSATGPMGVKVACEVTWEVADVDAAGKAKIIVKVDRLQLNCDSPLGKQHIDSKDGKDPEGQLKEMLGEFYTGLRSAEITMTVDPRGAVSDVQLPKPLATGARRTRGGPGLGDSYSEDGMKRLFSQGAQPLPEGPVAKGQTWDDSIHMKTRAGTMKVDTKYTYEGPTEQRGKMVETIALKPTITLEGGKVSTRTAIKKLDPKGKAAFDNVAGRLVELSLTQDGDIEVGPEGAATPYKVQATITWKLVEKGK